ncbi:MAG: ATP-binding protein [Ruminiclostridium sp.]|nr:ATP-binding protein [Ruminiclostridium sp.]
MITKQKYNFNISLSVLNHLGRNLYRNIITVLGEAISNSWDADAKNVWIEIDKENNTMKIVDDGIGMSDDDFQEKFLKIGYSKRKNGTYKSTSGRPFIGRKGIGKLALLSCSDRVHIATKKALGEVVGGIIDNSGLDKAITDDLNSQDYTLEPLDDNFDGLSNIESGTSLYFENLTNGIFNTVDYIKKAIAMYFRFSLIDSDFNIYVNEEKITEELLSDLADNTQFVWRTKGFKDPFLDTMDNLDECIYIKPEIGIKGYIATVKKPSNLKIRGAQEKATIDLFVNGRLREKDILRHLPTSRIVENYAYGQIHFDDLDVGDTKDVFTSSREGVISDDPTFSKMLLELKQIFKKIIDEWDALRRKHGNDGDPDNKTIPKKARKAQELFNATMSDMNGSEDEKFIKKGSVVDEWVKELSEEAQFNIPSYTECFVAENLLRHYVEHTQLPVTPSAQEEAERCRKNEERNKGSANISYDVRRNLGDLYYLDMSYLANLIDKVPDNSPKIAGLSRSASVYKPVRDAVGHTSLITEIAKQQLNTEYENIKARLVALLKEIDKEDDGK